MDAAEVKRARPDHPIHELLADRYSPYVFEPKAIERDKLLACLEAARWAASSYNEQPWSFLLAEREDQAEFERMLGCLMEANQAWAKNAGVLLITVVKHAFARNNKPNRVAEHDVGLAMGNFCTQATALGLAVHQMAGVDLEKARQEYAIPETHAPLTGVALGYAGDPDKSDNEALAHRDRAARNRTPLSGLLFHGKFGQPALE